MWEKENKLFNEFDRTMSKVKFNKITLSGNEDKRLQTLDCKKNANEISKGILNQNIRYSKNIN